MDERAGVGIVSQQRHLEGKSGCGQEDSGLDLGPVQQRWAGSAQTRLPATPPWAASPVLSLTHTRVCWKGQSLRYHLPGLCGDARKRYHAGVCAHPGGRHLPVFVS